MIEAQQHLASAHSKMLNAIEIITKDQVTRTEIHFAVNQIRGAASSLTYVEHLLAGNEPPLKGDKKPGPPEPGSLEVPKV